MSPLCNYCDVVIGALNSIPNFKKNLYLKTKDAIELAENWLRNVYRGRLTAHENKNPG